MFHYKAYQLHISSEISLPLLPSKHQNADIVIRKRRSLPEIKHIVQQGLLYHYNNTQYALNIPGTGNIYVADGKYILAHTNSPDKLADIKAFILSSGMAALLQQRGYLVIHASAIKKNNSAILLCGNSGAGKSTLAAAMLKKDFQLVADDLCILNNTTTPEIPTGYPFLKLWEDAILKNQITKKQLQKIRSKLNKYFWPVNKTEDLPSPLKSIIILQVNNKSKPSVTEIKGIDKLKAISAQFYHRNNIRNATLLKSQFKQLNSWLNQVNVYRLERPNEKKIHPEIIQMIEHAHRQR